MIPAAPPKRKWNSEGVYYDIRPTDQWTDDGLYRNCAGCTVRFLVPTGEYDHCSANNYMLREKCQTCRDKPKRGWKASPREPREPQRKHRRWRTAAEIPMPPIPTIEVGPLVLKPSPPTVATSVSGARLVRRFPA